MRKEMLAGIAVWALVVGAPPARADVILFEDGFEADAAANSVTQLVRWQVTGNVDVVGAGDKCGQAGGTSRCLDLDGTSSPASPVISTRAPLTLYPGQYELSFDLAGSRGSDGFNSVTVTLGGLYANTFAKNDIEPFERLTVPIAVAAKTAATLSFAHVGSVDNRGLLLDNVQLRLRQETPPVPAGGFARDVASCQQAIGKVTQTLVQKVVSRYARCLQDEARGKACDVDRRDAGIARDAGRARDSLDKTCTTAAYTALGHVGDAALTRERIVLMTVDGAIALIHAGYVADYGARP